MSLGIVLRTKLRAAMFADREREKFTGVRHGVDMNLRFQQQQRRKKNASELVTYPCRSKAGYLEIDVRM
jgi:hypothetical protein